VARLVPEADGVLAAARILTLTQGLNDEEAGSFEAILRASYERMGAARSAATPSVATYLGLQRPEAFDTVSIAGPAGAPEQAAVIFLHGYAGNFLVYCWEIAQAAAAVNALTLCPSVGSGGVWWTSGGEQTFLETLRHAREHGVQRVYLAGLSNGAAGASVIASKHAHELSGLILISGSRAKAPPAGLSTLVVQGNRDRMMPAALARAYAAAGGAQYEEVEGGHLVFLSRHQRVRRIIADFLKVREAVLRAR
jgi:pimeloyl-ACP methyl ester carboxylesterase